MAPDIPTPPRFRHGRVIMSSRVSDLVQQGRLNVQSYLQRHLSGDWGEVSARTLQANEAALRTKEALFSAYAIDSELKLWIITEADRTVTTLLIIRRIWTES
jgi:hypothetical protein